MGEQRPRGPYCLLATEVEQLGELRLGPRRQRERTAHGAAEPVFGSAAGRPSLHAEDAAHDHVEGDGLHARRERERASGRPRVDLPVGRLDDHVGVAGHGLAVEGRQQQPALAHVTGAERGQHGVGSHHRAQWGLRGERRRLVGLGREERAHMVGVGGDHHEIAADRSAQLEHLAQLPPRSEHELGVADAEAQGLDGPREWQSGRDPQRRTLAVHGTGG
jgi:hypothetical protein